MGLVVGRSSLEVGTQRVGSRAPEPGGLLSSWIDDRISSSLELLGVGDGKNDLGERRERSLYRKNRKHPLYLWG